MFNKTEGSKPGMVSLMNAGKWVEVDDIVSVWITSYTLLKKMDTCGLEMKKIYFPFFPTESQFSIKVSKKKLVK